MAEESPVFLYSRSFLKPGAKVPDPEVLPDITTACEARVEAREGHDGERQGGGDRADT